MNIVKMQEMLKDVPEQALIGYVKNPGQVPSYLALSELQRRKKMRQEAATQAKAPEQSVAEKTVAEAQPQPMNMGVAALPGAESVGQEEAYAKGGIIGYANRGEVSADDAYWAEQERAADERGVYGAVLGDWLGGLADLPSALRRGLTGGHLGDKPRAAEAPLAAQEYIDRRRARDAELAGRAAASKGMTPEELAYINRRTLENAAAQGVFTPAATPAAPTVPTAPRAPAAPGNPATRVSAAPAGGVAELLSYKPIAEDYSDLDAARIKERSAREGMQEWRDLIGEDPGRAALNERMAAMEARAAESERQAPWMALTKAGLAIAGGASPYALQNIGKGALVGVEDYSKSRDKLQEMEEKRFDMAQKLAAADRAETIAAAKYGTESEQYDKAHNAKLDLAKQEAKIRAKEVNATNELKVRSANLDAQLAREKIAAEEKMARDRNAATLKAAEITRSAAGDSKIAAMYDKARDNAQAVVKGLIDSGAVMVKTPAEYEQLVQQQYMKELVNLGLVAPSGASASVATPTGAGSLVKGKDGEFSYQRPR